MGLIDTDIAAIVGEALGGDDLLPEVKLTRPATAGQINPATMKREGAGSPITFTCRGVREDYSAESIARGIHVATHQKITIIAATLADALGGLMAPKKDDIVEVMGRRFKLTEKISQDPAGATWTCDGAGWTGN
jgi:hypothetical protein